VGLPLPVFENQLFTRTVLLAAEVASWQRSLTGGRQFCQPKMQESSRNLLK